MIDNQWISIESSKNLGHIEKMNICKSCENLDQYNNCNKCACHMPIKITIEGSSCPANKW